MANKLLNDARQNKKDEFYTQLSDIENELRHYKEHFRGKTVLCNCDDPRVSMFFHYFAYQFEALGLKRLITTCYKNQTPDLFSQHDCERAIWLEYTGDKNGNRVPDPKALEKRIAKLVADSDVQKKSGIWEYVLDGDERLLGIRAFDDNTRLEAYERQHGVCPLCGAHFELNEMEADHITPWRDGGRTVPANCQMLCRDCNRHKGAK